MEGRRYHLSFAELLDRLSIVSQKVIYAQEEEMKTAFISEREDILHDIDLFRVKWDAKLSYAAMVLQHINAKIWDNESGGRGEGGDRNYDLTHALNSNRAEVKKWIQEYIGGRIDHKLNYIKGAWDLRL